MMSDMMTGRETRAATRATARATDGSFGTAFDTAVATGMAWLDLITRMQRASLASLSVYSPGTGTRISASRPETEREAVVALGEERLSVGTRTVVGETTRIRRRVIATPVEQEVTLRDERVVIERRPGRPAAARDDAKRDDVLTETVIEMSDSRQFPQVWKTVHVAEEVVLRREVTERKEQVRETLRHDVLEVEHDRENRSVGKVGGAVPASGLGAIGRAVEAGTAEAARGVAEAGSNAAANAEALAQAATEATRPRAEPDPAAEERRRRDAGNQPQPGRKG